MFCTRLEGVHPAAFPLCAIEHIGQVYAAAIGAGM